MKCSISTLFSILLIVFSFTSFSQTLPVGTPVLDETARRNQLKGGVDINTSFQIRPLYFQYIWKEDSVTQSNEASLQNINYTKFILSKGKLSLSLLPVTINQQFNSHHPFGWNDGSMIPAKGYQSQLSAGLYSKFGPLSIQLRPEFVYAQNRSFTTFPSSHKDSIWKSYYYILNRIDNPEKFGDGNYAKLFPGQSSVRFNYKKLSLGISTENLWWGPGVRNALVMSNHAPGFKHITFNTTSPVKTRIGSFEWQIVSGILKGSDILPPDTSRTFEGQTLYNSKPNGDRYLNGMVVTWQPKWTKGLNVGISRAFYQYKSNVPSSVNGYLPVVSAFFKSNAQDENSYGRDQLFSLFFRLVMPESRAEVYAEYGRNDHSQNFRDLMLEPEHARAYILGVRKLFPVKKEKEVELFFELSHLQNPPTKNVRELEGWYTHYQVRHGYTNFGQVIGAGIGPGASSQTLGLNWLKGISKLGVMFERVVHNNDFYYDAFTVQRDFGRHWIDLSLSLNKSWMQKRFMYSANLSLVRSLNYQWQSNIQEDKNVDVTNVQAALSVSYLFR